MYRFTSAFVKAVAQFLPWFFRFCGSICFFDFTVSACRFLVIPVGFMNFFYKFWTFFKFEHFLFYFSNLNICKICFFKWTFFKSEHFLKSELLKMLMFQIWTFFKFNLFNFSSINFLKNLNFFSKYKLFWKIEILKKSEQFLNFEFCFQIWINFRYLN
jgi:hypothetical protein